MTATRAEPAATGRRGGRDVTVLAGDLGTTSSALPRPARRRRVAAGEMLHVHAHEVIARDGSRRAAPRMRGQHAARHLHRGRRRPTARCRASISATRRRSTSTTWPGSTAPTGGSPPGVANDGTATPCHSVVVTSTRKSPRDLLARMVADPNVRTVGAADGEHRTAQCADRGNCVPLLEGHRRRSADGVGQGLPASRVDEASLVVRHRHVPGRRSACRTCVRSSPPGPTSRRCPFTGRPGVATADHRRGRRRRAPRPVPTHGAAPRTPRARCSHGPVRRLVAAVELRRLPRRVLGRPRGRLARRRVDARQDDRHRARRRSRRSERLYPTTIARHPAGPQSVRAAAQRTRPRHRRRHGVPRVTETTRSIRADVHVRRRRQRRDVDPRLDRDVGPRRPHPRPHAVARRDQRHRPAAPASC